MERPNLKYYPNIEGSNAYDYIVAINNYIDELELLIKERALANVGTSEKDLRVCEVSGSLFSDSEIIDWLQIAMSPNSNYCELYLAGLRNFESDYAQAFQVESCPEKFKTVNAPTLREAVSLAMIAYNDR